MKPRPEPATATVLARFRRRTGGEIRIAILRRDDGAKPALSLAFFRDSETNRPRTWMTLYPNEADALDTAIGAWLDALDGEESDS